MSATDEAASALAAQIRTELTDEVPQGFLFTDHVIRQDAALERLTQQLRAHGDEAEVALALARAVADEKEGWTLLKLLELAERLALTGTSSALMQLARSPPGDDDRSRFLAGRACEVLLQLPLDYQTRLQANEVCKAPLEEIARFRMGSARASLSHRPRRIEWAILVVLMAVGLAGLLFALFA